MTTTNICDDVLKSLSVAQTDLPATNDVNDENKPLKKPDKKIKTEDTGKMFEMAICIVYGILYIGTYKYTTDITELFKLRLSKLTELFPMCTHTAKKGARYDFTSITDENMHLSAKSTKKGVGKVAPQVIGQSQPKKFCEILDIEFTTIPDLKEHIQKEIKQILPVLVSYTFDCPNIYFNQEKDTIRYITLVEKIDWNSFEFKWTKSSTEWKNSTTMKIVVGDKEIALLEIQFHTKSRTNMAIRWYYENFLTVFVNNLNIIDM